LQDRARALEAAEAEAEAEERARPPDQDHESAPPLRLVSERPAAYRAP
jgi:hypothetical protein